MMAETAERVYTLQSSAVFDTRIFVLCGHGGMVAQDPALVGKFFGQAERKFARAGCQSH